MAIPIRSHLLAGTAALVTATAVTATVVSAGGFGLPSMTGAVDVRLAALANPLLEIYDTIQKANYWMFSIAELPNPQGPLVYAGMVPDFLAAGFPSVTQYFLNAPDYINQSINYFFQDYAPNVVAASPYPGALRVLTWAVDALPANLGYAANQLFAGNLVGVLDTMKFAVANPIQAALYQALNSGVYVVGGVLARAAAVITAVAEWIPDAIRHVADDVTVVLNAAFNVVRNVAYGVQTGNPETVWNSLVVGLLGTEKRPLGAPYAVSIPDALINQTFGEGGRLYSDPVTYERAPSIREDLTDLRDKLAEALATDVPVPAEPPFPVSVIPNASQIPTPWQQTPYYVPPVAAVHNRTATAQAASARPATAKPKPRSAAVRAAAR